MSTSGLSVDDYLLYKEFEEFKAFKQKQAQQPGIRTRNLQDYSATKVVNDLLPNSLLNKIQDDPKNKSATTMAVLLSSTPKALIDAQVALDLKILGVVNSHFTDSSKKPNPATDPSNVKLAKVYKYGQDISGATPGSNYIDIPQLLFVNIPSFSFSSFSFDVQMEDRGVDDSGNLLVTPSKVSSKLNTYKVNIQLIDRGEPAGLTKLRGLLLQVTDSTSTVSTSAAQQAATQKKLELNRNLQFDTTK
jgi:hypothetical protein